MLPGGWVNEVVRIGDTVRRRRSSEFVHALLRRLDDWPGSPELLGVDDEGREILSYVDGHVAWEQTQPEAVTEDASLVRVAELVREFHDLTEQDGVVVCHNDLSPKNTVYRGDPLRPVAFIDWDGAAPGQRIHDVAHVCWQYLALGPGCDPGEARRAMKLICDAYRLENRDELVGTILWWQDRCWRGIEADNGPSGARLRAAGVVEQIQAAHAWVERHLTPGT